MDSTRSSRPQKSAAVTAVGIFTLVLGALNLLWLVIGLDLIAHLATDHGGYFRPFAWLGLFVWLLGCIFTVSHILAGAGVLRRKPWGRLLTLALAGVTLLGIVRNPLLFFREPNIVRLAGVLHAALALVILIRNREEFSSPQGSINEPKGK